MGTDAGLADLDDAVDHELASVGASRELRLLLYVGQCTAQQLLLFLS
ncbi:MAG TPA: hypothetical protein VID48_07990 [Solirubrobacteraceae bacterium]|jgi:hypothetical protein